MEEGYTEADLCEIVDSLEDFKKYANGLDFSWEYNCETFYKKRYVDMYMVAKQEKKW